jgi:NAD(P)-dependent dehydrogenase (short-subunit alcohol dehydrogenase family)
MVIECIDFPGLKIETRGPGLWSESERLRMSNHTLDGKSALVTGGARRIGREIALTLARAGADVAITYRKSHFEARETVGEIESLGRRALAVECDVRCEDSVREAVGTVLARFGRLDVLVNNAAIFESGALESISLEAWDAVFETNARGPFLVAREALAHLRAAEGRIVNIGSLGGTRAWAGHAHYCGSKAALHMLTQTMAKAFAPEVSVNCVAPGWIELDDQTEASARFAARTPMRRNGTADDAAQAVLFFAAGPKFVTGQILGVDGGLGLV